MADIAAAPTLAELDAAYSSALSRPLPLDLTFARVALRLIAATDEVSMWRLGRGKGMHFVDAVLVVSALEQAGLVEVSPRRMPDQVRLTAAGVGYCQAHEIPVSVRGPHGEISRPAATVPAGDPLAAVVMSPLRMDRARARRLVETMYDRSDVSIYRLKRASGEGLLQIVPVIKALEVSGLAVVIGSAHDDRARLTPAGRAMVRGWQQLRPAGAEVA